jgi:CHAT domain-containing protein/tetratricopeptide (TPR) repeat protein
MDDSGSAAFDLARLSIQVGDYGKARHALALAESHARETFGELHPNYAAVLQDQAKVERELGGPGKALPLCRKALAILRAFPSCPDAVIAACLTNLAFNNQALGLYHEAIEQLLEASKRVKENAEPIAQKIYTSSVTNLAQLYCEIGQDDRAEPLIREALEIDRKIYGPRDRALAASVNNLGVYLAQHGRFEEGERYMAEATGIIERALGTQNPEYASSLASGAYSSREARQYRKAEAGYTMALQILESIQAGNTPQAAQVRAAAALVFAARGKFAFAEGTLRKAIGTFEATLPRDHQDTNEARFSLFIVLAAQDKIDSAFDLLRDTMACEASIMDAILRLGSEKDRLAYLTRLTWRLDAAVSFVLQKQPSDPKFGVWLFELLLKRRGLSAEALAAQRDTILGNDQPELSAKLTRLNDLKRIVGGAMLDPNLLDPYLLDPNPDPERTRRLNSLAEEKADLERDLARTIPEIGLKLRLESLDFRTVAAELPPATALIEFVRYTNRNFAAVDARNERLTGPDRYVALVVRRGEPAPELVDLGEAPFIDELVGGFRAAIAGEGAEPHRGPIANRSLAQIMDALFPGRSRARELKRLGEAIEQSVIAPLKELLRGIERVVIVPDGSLMRLPFECIPYDDGFCIDRWQVNYLATGREMVRRPLSGAPRAGPPLVVAAPDYDLDSMAPAPVAKKRRLFSFRGALSYFPPLEGTRAEGEAVGKFLGVEPQLGAGALEAVVKSTRSPRILHIATHGFFFDRKEPIAGQTVFSDPVHRFSSIENPMLRSGLALAGANSALSGKSLPEDAEDGILTAEDVTALDLRGSELVVLSACETGLGDVRSGEGLFGLRRAFGLAGARALVVSLWKVADRETRELMDEFYSALLAGASTQAALQQANLKIRTRYRDPYFWGAFISLGRDF